MMQQAETEYTTGIVRTEMGLTIAHTRITLYDVMDYLSVGWPSRLIRDRLQLSDQQIDAAMAYIAAHRSEVETEYRAVLEAAQESRRYWEEYNRERFARLAAIHPPSNREALRAALLRRQRAGEPQP
jgi:uncharacterized protein (DUF433 family)